MAGSVVTLKLKRSDFSLVTKRTSLDDPTQMADRLFRTARDLFGQVTHSKPYRLLGVGLSHLLPEDDADRTGNLLDPNQGTRFGAERATDKIRARFGEDAILKGRSLR
jgi:DNA polymerase-4